MPARLRLASPAEVSAALAASPRTEEQTRLLVKHFMAVLEGRAPGRSVEVRVPPYAVAQCLAGTRHTRGTPPAVVEMDAATWVGIGIGDVEWSKAAHDARLVASGERSDLGALMPLLTPADPPVAS